MTKLSFDEVKWYVDTCINDGSLSSLIYNIWHEIKRKCEEEGISPYKEVGFSDEEVSLITFSINFIDGDLSFLYNEMVRLLFILVNNKFFTSSLKSQHKNAKKYYREKVFHMYRYYAYYYDNDNQECRKYLFLIKDIGSQFRLLLLKSLHDKRNEIYHNHARGHPPQALYNVNGDCIVININKEIRELDFNNREVYLGALTKSNITINSGFSVSNLLLIPSSFPEGYDDKIKHYLHGDSFGQFTMLSQKSFMEIIDNFKEYRKRKKLKIPEELITAFQEYLIFFQDFVHKTKGKEIDFQVLKIHTGVEIVMLLNKEIDDEMFSSYMDEYTAFLRTNIYDLKVAFETELSKLEQDVFIVELMEHIQALRKKVLRSRLYSTELYHGDFKGLVLPYEKEAEFRDRQTFDGIKINLTEGKVSVALEKLDIIIKNELPHRHNDIIILWGRHAILKRHESLGIISRENADVEMNRLINNILEFIDSL